MDSSRKSHSVVAHLYRAAFDQIDIASLVFFQGRVWCDAGSVGMGLSHYRSNHRTLCRAAIPLLLHGFRMDQAMARKWYVLPFLGPYCLATAICCGFWYRTCSLLFAIAFTLFFLMERTNYQNHYYLIALIAWWLQFLPLNQIVSIDAFLMARRTTENPATTFQDGCCGSCNFTLQFPISSEVSPKSHPIG